jgi:hypothetical protein
LLPWLNAGAATARQHFVSRDAALIALRAVNLSPVSGFPAIVVPAGFTRGVYDRVPDTSDPNGSRLDAPKPDQLPVAMEFLARSFDEARLFELASAHEAGTKHRRPPKGFGPLAGEPWALLILLIVSFQGARVATRRRIGHLLLSQAQPGMDADNWLICLVCLP